MHYAWYFFCNDSPQSACINQSTKNWKTKHLIENTETLFHNIRQHSSMTSRNVTFFWKEKIILRILSKSVSKSVNPNSDNIVFLCLKFQHIYDLNSVFFTATKLKWVRNSLSLHSPNDFSAHRFIWSRSEASECAAAPIKFLLSHTIRH